MLKNDTLSTNYIVSNAGFAILILNRTPISSGHVFFWYSVFRAGPQEERRYVYMSTPIPNSGHKKKKIKQGIVEGEMQQIQFNRNGNKSKTKEQAMMNSSIIQLLSTA